MKCFFGGLIRILGFWIMWVGLFALICPFLFPFPMWPQLKAIFDIVIFVFPIGFVIRFVGMFDIDLFEKVLYLIKDTFVILTLVSLPCIAVPIPYVIYHHEGYIAIVKGLIIIAIGIIGYILMKNYIEEDKEREEKKSKEFME